MCRLHFFVVTALLPDISSMLTQLSKNVQVNTLYN